MCGIAGIFNYSDNASKINQNELLLIRDHMTTRGPDGAGLWISSNKRIALAHRRLAIIDLTDSGHQPMSTADGRLHISFNGEIYNYLELRVGLEQKGCKFLSNSDTEVLLHLYRLEGHEMLSKLRGMFAIAIWDEQEQTLFLARDHFGIKPLYYADDGKTIRFASQVKAILAGGQVDTASESAGLVGFFLWGSVPEPYTSYKSIRALAAGTSLTIDLKGDKKQRVFFNLTEALSPKHNLAGSFSAVEALEQLHAALIDSVRHHLIADVPVGVFLSAGLDSSTLVGLAKEIGVAELRTITLGFNEYKCMENDETLLANKVADHYGTKHQTQWINQENFVANFEHLLSVMDQPSIDGVNSYFVCKAAQATGLKVVLSGIGGDELFGGYSLFEQIPKMVSALHVFATIPKFGTAFRFVSAPILKHFTSTKYAGLFEYGTDYEGAYLLRRGLFMPWELPEVLDGDIIREGWRELKTLQRLSHSIGGDVARLKITALETSWFMRNQLLRDADWASMAHSLELRVPLIDVPLFQTVTRLVHNGYPPSKHDMAISPKIQLPDSVLKRRKTGFATPIQKWLMDMQNVNYKSQRGLRGWAVAISGL